MRRPGFEVHRADVGGLTLAYLRAGAGGFPLLLLHGYPETKRIWWRNVAPLADAGFEVIVPDLRGFGDSDLAPDERYDVAAHARDAYALVHDVFGHDRRLRPEADYFLRQATDADALAAELDTPARRRAYVADFYGHRFWAAPGTFAREDVDLMTEPFADGDKLRASFANYEYATGNRQMTEAVHLFEKNPIPTLVLYGPEDHVVPRDFVDKAAVAFTECIGPFVVPGAGHFLQWERADVLNQAVKYFLRPNA